LPIYCESPPCRPDEVTLDYEKPHPTPKIPNGSTAGFTSM
jgi:hypothetical protein